MVDVLVVSVREERKGDFIIEFIKGLMSRGLVVCYAGACYCEKEDRYVYDNTTNLFFFSSTYFREASMKSKDFGSVKGFLSCIDFKQVDARLVISVIACTIGICEENGSQEQKGSIKGYLDYRKGRLEEKVGEKKEDYEKDSKRTSEILQQQICKLAQESRREEMSKSFGGIKAKTEELEKTYYQKIDLPEPDKLTNLDSFIFPFYARKESFRKRALHLYIEEEGGTREGANLFVYNEERIIDPQSMKRFDYFGKKFTPRREVELIPKIIHFDRSRDLYSLESIKQIIDEHILPSLHPPLVEIFFPDKFVLEVDPEEPDIGFVSMKADEEQIRKLEDLSFIAENLGIYKFKGERVIEVRLDNEVNLDESNTENEDNGSNEPKNILMVGRIRDLAQICFTDWRKYLGYSQLSHIFEYLPILNIIILSLLSYLDEKVKILILIWVILTFVLYFIFRISRKKHLGYTQFDHIFKHILIPSAFVLGLLSYFGEKLEVFLPSYFTEEMQILILTLAISVLILYFIFRISRKKHLGYTQFDHIFKHILIPSAFVLGLLSYFGGEMEISFPALVISIFVLYFVFWISQSIVLNYVLEPIYGFYKSTCYTVIIVSFAIGAEHVAWIIAISLIVVTFVFFFSFRNFIWSAVCSDLNKSFEILEGNDEIYAMDGQNVIVGELAEIWKGIKGFVPALTKICKGGEMGQDSDDNQSKEKHIESCGSFFTLFREVPGGTNIQKSYNSDFFRKIGIIGKKKAMRSREMSYGSGVFFLKEKRIESSKSKGKLFYENDTIHKDYSEISKPSASIRTILFGKAHEVKEDISNAIPVFPLSELYRNILILAVLSALVFNALRVRYLEMMLSSKKEYLLGLSLPSTSLGRFFFFFLLLSFVLLLIFFLLVLITTEIHMRSWKMFLILLFNFLVLFQTFFLQMISFFVFWFIFFAYWLPIKQIWYFCLILWNELWEKEVISIEISFGKETEARIEKGVKVRKDYLFTTFALSPIEKGEEIIVFNDCLYHKIKENQGIGRKEL